MENPSEQAGDEIRDPTVQSKPEPIQGAGYPSYLELNPGYVFEDRFLIESSLGKGGAGQVYQCQDIILNRKLALKLLHKSAMASEQNLRRFKQEAQALQMLSHPNLLQVYKFGVSSDGQPYLLLPLVEGENLAVYLKTHGAMGANEALPIICMVCSALEHMHEKGVVHRDLKPGNIMLTRDSDCMASVQIVDFGFAKLLEHAEISSQNITGTGEIFGSPLYMSPEQWRAESIDERSDIYSLACLSFELISGKTPWNMEELMQFVLQGNKAQIPKLVDSLGQAVSPQLQATLSKALSSDSSLRYQYVRELLCDLQKTPEYKLASGAHATSLNARILKSKAFVFGFLFLCMFGIYWVAFSSAYPTKARMVLLELWLLADKCSAFEANKDSLSRRLELADLQRENGQTKEAISNYRVALDSGLVFGRTQARALYQVASLLEIEGVHGLASRYARLAELPLKQTAVQLEKEHKFNEAIEIFRDIAFLQGLFLPPVKNQEAETWNHIGQLEEICSKTDSLYSSSCLQSYLQALDCLNAAERPDETVMASVLYNLGSLSQQRKQLDESFNYLRRAKVHASAGLTNVSSAFATIASVFSKLASSYMSSENYPKAAESYKEAIGCYERSGTHEWNEFLVLRLSYGRALSFCKRSKEAAVVLKEAVAQARTEAAGDSTLLANLLIGLVEADIAIGQKREAKECLNELFSLIKGKKPLLDNLRGACDSALSELSKR